MKKNVKKILCMVAVASLLLTGCGANAKTSTETDTSDHGKNGYVIEDGQAQPILEYTAFWSDGYSNDNSDILRFCVYVETDHDTDNDGMADLVKVFCQVPTAAVEGKYKAAVIYDPTPYNVGTAGNYDFRKVSSYYDTGFDYSLLYKDCEKRPGAEEISTMDLAVNQNPNEYNYTVTATGAYGYGYSDLYDYYLVRGFAVVEASGIGTLGSEGYELCGMDLEAEAHACVVEWLTGNRVAYSDKDATNEVKADWSNGKVAMTGCSYGGTLPFEVATLGVEGLETIIPFAGIARWYDYTNSQGVTKYYEGKYMDYLASYNSGSLFLDDNWTVINPDYAAWLTQIANDQNEANGNYTDVWKISDYSNNYEKIHCSALIVHGLNDFNVNTIQSDLMVKAFTKAGQTVKLVFHQDGHNILDGLMVGDEVWQSIMNQWLCHYLLDVDNGIENMAPVTYESNVDGLFYTADKWRDFNYEKSEASYDTDKTTLTSKGIDDAYAAFCAERGLSGELLGSGTECEFYVGLPENLAKTYNLDVSAGTTVYGVPTVSFSASPTVGGLAGLRITAILLDVADDESPFQAYLTDASIHNRVPYKTTDYFDVDQGYNSGSGSSIKEFVKSYTKAKLVTIGWTDLANPGGGEDPSDYAEDVLLEAGKSYEYTFYMMPTVYTLEEGHHLELVLLTNDPMRSPIVDDIDYVDYGYTIDNTTLNVEIPTLK